MEIKFFNLNVVVVLDIGMIKVCVIVGWRNEYGKFEILGFGKVDFEGVLRGVVLNIEKIVKVIVEVIEYVCWSVKMDFKVVYVGIVG